MFGLSHGRPCDRIGGVARAARAGSGERALGQEAAGERPGPAAPVREPVARVSAGPSVTCGDSGDWLQYRSGHTLQK